MYAPLAPPWRQTLTFRITLGVLVIFLTGIWGLSYYASRMLRADTEGLLADQQFSTVSYVAAEINRALEDRFRALDIIARSIDAKMMEDPAAVQRLLEGRPIFQDIFNAGVLALASEGTAIADISETGGRVGTNYIDYDAFRIALTENRASVGKPVMGRRLGAPAFSLAMPIRDGQGKVIGVLAGTTVLSKANFLDTIGGQRYGKTGGYMIAAPQHDLFVNATDKSRILQPLPTPGVNLMFDRYRQGFEGSGVAVSSRGVEELSSAKLVPLAGWVVIAALPTSEAFGPIRDMQAHILTAALLLTLVTGAATWWWLARQFTPLAQAARQLRAMTAGDQPLHPLPVARQDEAGALIGGFNQLFAKLHASEVRFQAVFENAGIGISLADESGRLLSVNPSLCQMLGYEAFELTGKTWQQLTYPENLDKNVEMYKEVAQGERQGFSIEKRYITKSGEILWGLVNVARVADQDGAAGFLVATVADITERKRATEVIKGLLERNQSILDTVGEGIYGLNAEGQITFINPAALSMLGWSQDELTGTDTHALIHHTKRDGTPNPRESCPVHGAMREAKPHKSADEIFWRKDGTSFPVEMLATPLLRDGKAAGSVVVFHDITRQMETEEEIRRSNEELQRFAYVVSHDLQEPLRMVASYTALLGRKYAGKLDGEADEFINYAVDGAKRMQQMIADLLEYSRIQRSKTPFQRLALDACLDEALSNLQLAIEESQAEITRDPLPELEGDEALLMRLLQNLIGNAIKYRADGRRPRIHVGCSRRDGSYEITVADNGIGIEPAHYQRIFEVFQRLHGRGKYDGTGIGLAVARRIVERHGGRIWVTSAPGEGSVFHVTLPSGVKVSVPREPVSA
jgi:PAS domain S-box-containing protein